MWVFLRDSFLSVVADPNDPDQLLVRARKPGDIEVIFPEAIVVENPIADYRYRARLERRTVAEAIYRQVMAIDYRNFQQDVKDEGRLDAYLSVWATMYRYQYDTDHDYREWA